MVLVYKQDSIKQISKISEDYPDFLLLNCYFLVFKDLEDFIIKSLVLKFNRDMTKRRLIDPMIKIENRYYNLEPYISLERDNKVKLVVKDLKLDEFNKITKDSPIKVEICLYCDIADINLDRDLCINVVGIEMKYIETYFFRETMIMCDKEERKISNICIGDSVMTYKKDEEKIEEFGISTVVDIKYSEPAEYTEFFTGSIGTGVPNKTLWITNGGTFINNNKILKVNYMKGNKEKGAFKLQLNVKDYVYIKANNLLVRI